MLSVDLDCHNGETDLEERYWNVRGAFPCVPFVFSSPNRGLHLHYPLTCDTLTPNVLEYGKSQICDAGITLESGAVELYPSGRPFRVPLGPSSSLLDPQTLCPVGNHPNDSLSALFEVLVGAPFERLAIPETFAQKSNVHAEVAPRDGKSKKVRSGTVEDLLNVGLTGPSQRNEAFMTLTRYWRGQGVSVEDTANMLWTWIQEKHNGFSEDFRNNPQEVRRHTQRVARFMPDRQASIPRDPTASPLDQFRRSLVTMATRKGKVHDAGVVAEIPSRTLKSLDRDYGKKLQQMILDEDMEKVSNHSNRLHRCNCYNFPKQTVIDHAEDNPWA